MKKITEEQINSILSAVYATNMPAMQFDNLKKFFSDLENIEDNPKK